MLSRPEEYILHSGSADGNDNEEDDSLENDLSSLMEDDSDRQLVQTGAPTVFGPSVPATSPPPAISHSGLAVHQRLPDGDEREYC